MNWRKTGESFMRICREIGEQYGVEPEDVMSGLYIRFNSRRQGNRRGTTAEIDNGYIAKAARNYCIDARRRVKSKRNFEDDLKHRAEEYVKLCQNCSSLHRPED